MILAAGPFGLGPLELGLIVLVLILLFGATRLADVGGSLGKGIKEFRKNVKEEVEDTETPVSAAATPNGSGVIAAVKCAACGSLNTTTAKHCSQCGAALQAPVA